MLLTEMPVTRLFINWRNLVVPLRFSLCYHDFQAAHSGRSLQVTSFSVHEFTFGHLFICSYLFPDGVHYFSYVFLMTAPKSECMYWLNCPLVRSGYLPVPSDIKIFCHHPPQKVCDFWDFPTNSTGNHFVKSKVACWNLLHFFYRSCCSTGQLVVAVLCCYPCRFQYLW